MASSNDIRPFRITVSEEQLGELKAKLDIARLPDELDLPEAKQWDWGIPLSVLRPTLEYWRTQYDWRAVEARLNDTLPQFITHVDSIEHGPQEVHFVHKRSKNAKATPLIFVHGWPGNFLEVSKMIDQLADPTNPNDPSFHVVAPSRRASTPGMDAKTSAFMFDKLMAKLGYHRYLAQGGDWGALVCRALSLYHQDTCFGTHLNFTFSAPPSFLKHPFLGLKTMLGFSGLPGGLSADEVEALRVREKYLKTGRGYFDQQSTKPQTLAVGLTDSPVGLLAWIGEKLYAWTDNYPWTPEEMITWTMLYWINGPSGGLRYYKENALALSGTLGVELRTKWSPTPFGFSSFPADLYCPPLEWIATTQNVCFAKKHAKGGHFAAWEVPDLLVDDIRKFTSAVLSEGARPTGFFSSTTLLLGLTAAACTALVLPRVAPRLLGNKM